MLHLVACGRPVLSTSARYGRTRARSPLSASHSDDALRRASFFRMLPGEFFSLSSSSRGSNPRLSRERTHCGKQPFREFIRTRNLIFQRLSFTRDISSVREYSSEWKKKKTWTISVFEEHRIHLRAAVFLTSVGLSFFFSPLFAI